jgi:3-oxoacyl-[acyl-carrier protein] reductase
MARNVLVTGASRGIGRAIATALARQGFDLVLNYRADHEAAEESRALVETEGARARLLPFDVSERAAAAAALEDDMKAHGPYWGVVCNAGLHSDAPFPTLKAEAWDRVISVNLDGFYNVLKPVVMPMVRAHQGGRIVTLSSLSGVAGNRGQVNYSAAKAGLIGATKALAQELAKREITVNSVAPGLIDTEMIEGAPIEEILKRIPMRRLGKPEEIAAVVSFLFSEGAAYMTGQVLQVNGGML